LHSFLEKIRLFSPLAFTNIQSSLLSSVKILHVQPHIISAAKRKRDHVQQLSLDILKQLARVEGRYIEWEWDRALAQATWSPCANPTAFP
jgi:hypothetical protein